MLSIRTNHYSTTSQSMVVHCQTWLTCMCLSQSPGRKWGSTLDPGGAMPAPDPPSSGLTWTFVFWLTQLTLVTTDTEIRNQNTAGKPGAEIQNTFYISWLGLCWLFEQSVFSSFLTYLLPVSSMPKFLSWPPKIIREFTLGQFYCKMWSLTKSQV